MPTITPEQRFAAVAEALLSHPDVTLGSPEKRGFGSSALQVNGKIFAMVSQERLIVKLPRQRVDALLASGAGERFSPRRDGRLMKEWLAVASSYTESWLPLVREALEFVASTR
jgi:TfoX/Sxy family transcriptional regulator of competence genes